jgi:hypothetical protein
MIDELEETQQIEELYAKDEREAAKAGQKKNA